MNEQKMLRKLCPDNGSPADKTDVNVRDLRKVVLLWCKYDTTERQIAIQCGLSGDQVHRMVNTIHDVQLWWLSDRFTEGALCTIFDLDDHTLRMIVRPVAQLFPCCDKCRLCNATDEPSDT